MWSQLQNSFISHKHAFLGPTAGLRAPDLLKPKTWWDRLLSQKKKLIHLTQHSLHSSAGTILNAPRIHSQLDPRLWSYKHIKTRTISSTLCGPDTHGAGLCGPNTYGTGLCGTNGILVLFLVSGGKYSECNELNSCFVLSAPYNS